MADERSKALYEKAWKGDASYSAKEAIRLVKACELIRADARRQPSKRRYEVLDAGCGIGPLFRWLPAHAFSIQGLDISEEAAAIASRNYDVCRVGQVEEPWPWEGSSVDAVHAGAILEHVVDWHTPLNQANRVLRPGGLLVVSVPNLRYWKEVKRLVCGRLPQWMCVMQHLHAYTPRFLKQLVAIHGFRVESLEADRLGLPFLPDQSRWVTRGLANFGSVMILSARLQERIRVEDNCRAHQFAQHAPVGCRSVAVHEGASTAPAAA